MTAMDRSFFSVVPGQQLGACASQMVARLVALQIDSHGAAAPLAMSAFQLARCIDAAAAKGHGSAASQAARELRETVAQVETLVAAQSPQEDPFDALVAALQEP